MASFLFPPDPLSHPLGRYAASHKRAPDNGQLFCLIIAYELPVRGILPRGMQGEQRYSFA